MFQKEEYIQRRSSLTAEFDAGVLLFLGNDESPMNYVDNTYHFRQDSSFLYYFGIASPKLAALIDVEENQVILFGDEMSMDDIVWMGQQQTLREKAALSGVTFLEPSAALENYLKRIQQQKRQVHFLPPYRGENKIRLHELLEIPLGALKEHSSKALIKAVVKQRSIKSAPELVELDKASTISAEMQLLAMQLTKPGMKEYEVVAAIHHEAMRHGGQVAYPVILTINGQILHNHDYGNVIQPDRMVLNDCGAETAMGYAGDLTRTFPGGKRFTARQRELYEIVLKSYQDAVNMLKPGARYLDVHFRACLSLAEGMKSLGLMKGNMEEAVRRGAHALFFQCGTGHMMGLDVHDMEDLGEQYVGYTEELKKETTLFGLKSLRLGKELEEGYVLTVEPGLYFIPELIERWQQTRQFDEFINYSEVQKYIDFGGIRVEDDYVITESGFRKLGRDLAIAVNDVEAIRDSAW